MMTLTSSIISWSQLVRNGTKRCHDTFIGSIKQECVDIIDKYGL